MDANKYLSFFYGNKEEAIKQLEKSIHLYNNNRPKTDKVLNRIRKYKSLLSQLKSN